MNNNLTWEPLYLVAALPINVDSFPNEDRNRLRESVWYALNRYFHSANTSGGGVRRSYAIDKFDAFNVSLTNRGEQVVLDTTYLQRSLARRGLINLDTVFTLELQKIQSAFQQQIVKVLDEMNLPPSGQRHHFQNETFSKKINTGREEVEVSLIHHHSCDEGGWRSCYFRPQLGDFSLIGSGIGAMGSGGPLRDNRLNFELFDNQDLELLQRLIPKLSITFLRRGEPFITKFTTPDLEGSKGRLLVYPDVETCLAVLEALKSQGTICSPQVFVHRGKRNLSLTRSIHLRATNEEDSNPNVAAADFDFIIRSH